MRVRFSQSPNRNLRIKGVGPSLSCFVTVVKNWDLCKCGPLTGRGFPYYRIEALCLNGERIKIKMWVALSTRASPRQPHTSRKCGFVVIARPQTIRRLGLVYVALAL